MIRKQPSTYFGHLVQHGVQSGVLSRPRSVPHASKMHRAVSKLDFSAWLANVAGVAQKWNIATEGKLKKISKDRA